MEDFDIQDDVEVNPATYPDRDITPKPPLPGNYLFKPSKWDYRKDKQGQLILWKDQNGNPKYPVVGLTTVEITDPFEYGRKVVVFQDIPSYPFSREGRIASQTADLLRAFDATLSVGNTGEILKEVSDRLNGQVEFRARLDYTAYDKDYAAQLIADAGGKDKLNSTKEGKKELNALYRKAKVQGYRNIAKDNIARGQASLPLHKWAGPSGAVIDVQPTLTVFYPSDDSVQLGPDRALTATK